MRYFLVAGEPSGDMYGARLMAELKREDPAAQFRYYGGDAMAAEAEGMVCHYRELAIMGFVEVLTHLSTIRRNLRACVEAISEFKPDALILIDFGGFNLRLARLAKRKGVRVFYYIVPKVWAWNEGRVKKLKRYVDALFVIFPFEVPYFRKHGIEPIYVGNPLIDFIAEEKAQERADGDNRPLIALLPGSRRQEVRLNLDRMLQLPALFPEYHFTICAADSISDEELSRHLAPDSNVEIARGNTRATLGQATAAVVTSGTATLEAALMGAPEVVVYRGSWPSMLIARMLIKVPWVSLVNLILGRGSVRELLQMDYTVKNLAHELRAILPGGEKRREMESDFAELRTLLGTPGVSKRVAQAMVEQIEK